MRFHAPCLTLAALLLISTAGHAARPMVSAGHAFSAALHSNGTVYAWGTWACSSVNNDSVPELLPGLTGITAIAAGNDHLLALKSDGTVLAVGSNSDGQLGNGTFGSTCNPVAVQGLTGVTAIAAGAFTSYALLGTGVMRSWGDSIFGALGASGSDRTTPGASPNLTSVIGIAAGNDASFGLAIRTGGAVWGWGDNLRLQLGFSTGFASNTSTAARAGSLTNVRRLAAGSYHTVASRTDGTVYTWGWNLNGELGSGTIGGSDRVTPASVPGATGVVEVAAGQDHNIAVRYDGTVLAWGQGTFGQLGDNGSSNRGTPVVISGISDAVQASAGYSHSLVLASDGTVWAFGLGFYGAVGDGTSTTRATPVKVKGPGNVGVLNLGPVAIEIPASDTDGDGIPDIMEAGEGRNLSVRDNDLFADGRLFAKQQYRDFLAREGDGSGVNFWANQIAGGRTRAQVVESFFGSLEFQGTIAPVARLYFAYFLRVPDYDGLNFWISYYRGGNSLAAISGNFASSAEFVSRYGSLSNGQFVDLVYQNVLGRAPDTTGRGFWTAELDSGRRSRGQVMLDFSESPEYRALINSEIYVTMMYVGMLRRVPEPGGFSFWVDYLDQGKSGLDLINGFLAATEYRNRFLP